MSSLAAPGKDRNAAMCVQGLRNGLVIFVGGAKGALMEVGMQPGFVHDHPDLA